MKIKTVMSGRCTCEHIATNHGGMFRMGACMECACGRFCRDGASRVSEMMRSHNPTPSVNTEDDMKKPHEQEWMLDRHMVVNEDGKGVCRMQGSGATTEAEALILAAPNMARALMGRSGKGHDAYNPQRDEYACHWCAHFAPGHADGCECGSSLKKAGVL